MHSMHTYIYTGKHMHNTILHLPFHKGGPKPISSSSWSSHYSVWGTRRIDFTRRMDLFYRYIFIHFCWFWRPGCCLFLNIWIVRNNSKMVPITPNLTLFSIHRVWSWGVSACVVTTAGMGSSLSVIHTLVPSGITERGQEALWCLSKLCFFCFVLNKQSCSQNTFK